MTDKEINEYWRGWHNGKAATERKIKKEVEKLFRFDCCSSDQTEIILELQKRLLKKEPKKRKRKNDL